MWRYMKAYLQYGMPHIQFNVINNQFFVPLFMAQPIFELVYVHVKIVLDGCLVYRGAVTYNATYVDLVFLSLMMWCNSFCKFRKIFPTSQTK